MTYRRRAPSPAAPFIGAARESASCGDLLCVDLLGVGFGSARLQAVQEGHRLFRVGGGLENRPLVVFENFDPRGDIGSVILSGLDSKSKVGREVGAP